MTSATGSWPPCQRQTAVHHFRIRSADDTLVDRGDLACRHVLPAPTRVRRGLDLQRANTRQFPLTGRGSGDAPVPNLCWECLSVPDGRRRSRSRLPPGKGEADVARRTHGERPARVHPRSAVPGAGLLSQHAGSEPHRPVSPKGDTTDEHSSDARAVGATGLAPSPGQRV